VATFTYDDSATLAANKNDGGAVTDTTKATATEWNQVANAVTDLRTDMRAGDYHGLKDMTAALPALAPSGGARLAVQSNKVTASVDGGPYIWIKSVDYIALADPRFGAVMDGVTDDAAALQLAINATLVTNTRRKVLVLPDGDVCIKSKVTVPGSLGFTMIGSGAWCSRIIVDPTTPSDDALVINSSQHVTLEGFSLWGLSANPAGRMIYFDYDPVVYASYGHHLREVWINSENARMAYDYGISFSDAYGNNSEVGYYDVMCFKFIEAGVHLQGSQQKAHCFYNCQMNGAWDGVTTAVNGGKYGIQCEDGNYSWFGGGMSSCSVAGFTVGAPNDPIVISGCQSENCYRFLDGGDLATNGRKAVTVVGCRIDNLNLVNPQGIVSYGGIGPFIFDGNEVNGHTSASAARVKIACASPSTAIRVTNNMFNSLGSVGYSPIINGGVYWPGSWNVENNLFNTAAGSAAIRDEVLDTETSTSQPPIPILSQWNRHGTSRYYIGSVQFTAAATSETITLCTLPKGTRIKSCGFYSYDTWTASGNPTVTLKLGTTSGGAEVMREMRVGHATVNATQQIWEQKSDMGALMAASAQGGGRPTFFVDTPIYATVTRDSGNLGNGATTSFTNGYGFFFIEVEVQPRYVPGA